MDFREMYNGTVGMPHNEIERYLPLTETTYYILLALAEPLHGYAVMQKIAQISEGQVRIGAGTLYNAFTNLRKEGLIVIIEEDDRRKVYELTGKGRTILRSQFERLEVMTRSGRPVVEML
jgi:DNA-binding PadR family transcriptional regulator